MKKYNQYFNIFKTTLEDPGELISTIRVRYNEKIWEKINNEYLDTQKWLTTSIFHLDIKSYTSGNNSLIYNLIFK